mgnify:CR=1 FL=1
MKLLLLAFGALKFGKILTTGGTMLLSLAFLAPSLVKAIAENRMPRGIGLTRMTDLPSEWPMQWRALGLSENASG